MMMSDQFAVPDKERGVVPVLPVVIRQAQDLLLRVLVPINECTSKIQCNS